MPVSKKFLPASAMLLAAALIAGPALVGHAQPKKEVKPPTAETPLDEIMEWASTNAKRVGADAKANKLGPQDAPYVVQMELAMILAKTKPAPKAEKMTGDEKAKPLLG